MKRKEIFFQNYDFKKLRSEETHQFDDFENVSIDPLSFLSQISESLLQQLNDDQVI